MSPMSIQRHVKSTSQIPAMQPSICERELVVEDILRANSEAAPGHHEDGALFFSLAFVSMNRDGVSFGLVLIPECLHRVAPARSACTHDILFQFVHKLRKPICVMPAAEWLPPLFTFRMVPKGQPVHILLPWTHSNKVYSWSS